MKINKNSWFVKLILICFREEYYTNKYYCSKLPESLCTLFWVTVGAIITSIICPFFWISKWINKLYVPEKDFIDRGMKMSTAGVCNIGCIVLFGSIISIIRSAAKSGWWPILSVIFTIFGVIAGIAAIVFGIYIYNNKVSDNSFIKLTFKTLGAKKKKICPIIEYQENEKIS